MSNIRKQLADALARINKDKELATELHDKRSRLLEEAAGRLGKVENELAMEGRPDAAPLAGLAKALASDASAIDSQQEFVTETIVLRQGRPVLAIANDEPKLEFREAESEVWRERLLKARASLAAAARAVGRIELIGHPTFSWVGTGWLVGPETIVTNRHVAQEFGRDTGEKFVFKMGLGGRPMTASIDFLEEIGRVDSLEFSLAEILHIEPASGPDIAFLRVAPSGNGLATPLGVFEGPAIERQQVAAIGYPARDSRIPEQQLMEDIFGNVYDKKRLAPGEITAVTTTRLEHDCSTLGGNSGSVILDLQSGKALAIHFAGRFLKANYAVPGTVIMDRLSKIGRGGRRPAPDRRAVDGKVELQRPSPATQQGQLSTSNQVTVTVPVTITVDIGTPFRPTPAEDVKSKRPAARVSSRGDDEVFIERRPEDYANRRGYDSGFLGVEVPLPEVVEAAEDVLTFEEDGDVQSELKYQNFSVVMSSSRRLCRFSAVNIDGKLSRRTQRTGWVTDPRIPREAQILKECYGDPPKFSRGHMTRREDPAWGDEAEADLGNRDSMHVTNTVPQLQVFNGGVWLALEDYALQNARRDKMRISVFTGPFLTDEDQEEHGVLIPSRFWKVIAFIHDETNQLCATGYTMSQQEALDGREFVFGQHKTTQTSIGSIEIETGLSFGGLADIDPMADAEESLTAPLLDTNHIRFI